MNELTDELQLSLQKLHETEKEMKELTRSSNSKETLGRSNSTRELRELRGSSRLVKVDTISYSREAGQELQLSPDTASLPIPYPIFLCFHDSALSPAPAPSLLWPSIDLKYV